MTAETKEPDREAAGRDVVLDETAGPDVVLDEAAKSWQIWAWVNAADDHGIQISGVKADDELTVEFISGIGYFAGASGWSRAFSVAITVGAAVVGAAAAGVMTKMAAKGLEAVNKAMPNDEKASKPRDGYGEKVGGGGIAHEEGGIVIYPPITGGPKYSSERPVGGGPGQNGSFFPTRGNNKLTIQKDGTLSVVAFDTNYADNAGRYEVKLHIRRP